ncbi:MAG: AAA family ATPase [Elusimicrobiota bacterium]|jgi:DNA polymerase-3 subunit delta'|nr:AAA family ATPase [Elusimicrobiota bacterium]
MSFKRVLGQSKALNTLKGFLAASRVPRAMVFAGPAGVGKAAAALEVAKTLNCLDKEASKNFDNCGVCVNCRQIDARAHPDVIFADFAYQAALLDEEIEKQQTIKVKTIRHLTAASQQKPSLAKWKVYIIDSAEKLQAEGANALLKFLEEPAPNTVWILISAKREALLTTIKSRTQPVVFAPLSADIIKDILKQNYVEDGVAAQAAFYAQGSTAKAFAAAEVLGDFAPLPKGAAFAPQAAGVLSKTLAAARGQASSVLDMLAASAHKEWQAAADAKTKDALAAFISKLSFYKKALGRNTSPQLITEAALIAAEEYEISL